MDGHDNEDNHEEKVAEDDGDGPASVDTACELHHICSHCEGLIAKVFNHEKGPPFSGNHCILSDPIDVPEHLVHEQCQEKITSNLKIGFSTELDHTLHDSIESLRSSVASRCHLCTLIWERLHSSADPRCPLTTHEFQSTTKAENIENPLTQRKHGKVIVRFNEIGDMTVTCVAEGNPIPRGYREGWYLMKCYHEPSTFEHKARRFLSTASSSHQELARYWFDECLRGHPQCGGSKSGFRPTRLLFIPSVEASHIRLNIFNNSNSSITYFALSHCWGGATDMLTLQRDNIDDMSKSISVAKLPKSFQHAIKIVASLGGQYLWIDSLCIVQDCPTDWTRESTAMGSIYENALCNISAHAAEDSHHGCWTTRDPLRFSPCKLMSTSNYDLYAAIPRREVTEYAVLGDSRLSSRGWTFQETLLSARILHLGQLGIYWSCREGYATEIEAQGSAGPIEETMTEGCIFGPSSIVSADKVGPAQTLYKHFLDMSLGTRWGRDAISYEMDLFKGKSETDWANEWYAVVRQYSKRSLTKPEDKIVALSAVAQRIARLSGKIYAAGLWKEHFLHNLLWFTDQDSGLFRVPAEYRGPSWSWVSVDGEIRHLVFGARRSYRITELARVIDISVSTHEIDTQDTGRIFGASCTIKGSLASAHKLMNRIVSPLAKKKGFRKVQLDRYSYVSVYPDSTGYWPSSKKLFLMQLRRIRSVTEGIYPERVVLGIILQIDESETSGRRYRRVGAFEFCSRKRKRLGGWDHGIKDSRVLGTWFKQVVTII